MTVNDNRATAQLFNLGQERLKRRPQAEPQAMPHPTCGDLLLTGLMMELAKTKDGRRLILAAAGNFTHADTSRFPEESRQAAHVCRSVLAVTTIQKKGRK